jgi:hypothetical protein
MGKQVKDKTEKLEGVKPVETKKAIGKEAKKFDQMREKMKAKGFMARVPDKSDKEAVCDYINSEVDRYVTSIKDRISKVTAWYKAEKTRIRRTKRQQQSERAKNSKAEVTKVQLDEQKDEELTALKA